MARKEEEKNIKHRCLEEKGEKNGPSFLSQNWWWLDKWSSLYSVIARHALELPVFETIHNSTSRIFSSLTSSLSCFSSSSIALFFSFMYVHTCGGFKLSSSKIIKLILAITSINDLFAKKNSTVSVSRIGCFASFDFFYLIHISIIIIIIFLFNLNVVDSGINDKNVALNVYCFSNWWMSAKRVKCVHTHTHLHTPTNNSEMILLPAIYDQNDKIVESIESMKLNSNKITIKLMTYFIESSSFFRPNQIPFLLYINTVSVKSLDCVNLWVFFSFILYQQFYTLQWDSNRRKLVCKYPELKNPERQIVVNCEIEQTFQFGFTFGFIHKSFRLQKHLFV